MRISDWSSDVCSSDLCESIKNRPFVSGFGDKALEAGFVNLDLPHRSGEHAAVRNQKGFGGISANDNPRRQRQTCAIEEAIRNFHRSRMFDIKAIASSQMDYPRLEELDILRGITGRWGKLQLAQTKILNMRYTLHH